MIKQHLVVCRPGFSGALAAELTDRWMTAASAGQFACDVVHKAAVAVPERVKLPALHETVFARQYLPAAMRCHGSLGGDKSGDEGGDKSGDETLVEFFMDRLEVLARRRGPTKGRGEPAGRWTLHCFAIDDDPAIARAIKVEKALMAAIRARMPDLAKAHVAPQTLADDVEAGAAQKGDALYQIFIAGPDDAWVSMAPLSAWAQTGMSLHPGGVRRMRKVAGAPSRSSSKLSEALEFMKDSGIDPVVGETAVDLGAAPGGWTLVMALRGVDVTAVDHAELDLPDLRKAKTGGNHITPGKVTHLRENGLKFRPDEPVDWLCCDMVMGSRQTLDVLRAWMDADLMRRFVVNIKLPQAEQNTWPAVKEALDLFAAHRGSGRPEWRLLTARHLFHDRSEVTLMGAKSGAEVR